MKLLILLFIAAAAAHPGIMWMELLHAPFLAEVSWNAQFDYFKILYNQTLTIAKQKEEIKLWAKRNEVSKEVTSFFHKFNKRMEKTNKDVAKVIHALPTALRDLTKIMKNEKQTLPEMMAPRTSRAHTKRTQNRMRDVKSRMSPLPMDLHSKPHAERQTTHKPHFHEPHSKQAEEHQATHGPSTHETHPSTHEEGQVTHKSLFHEPHPKPEEELQVTHEQVTHETHPSPHEVPEVTSKPDTHEPYTKPYEEHQATHGPGGSPDFHPKPHGENVPLGGPEPEKTQQGKNLAKPMEQRMEQWTF
uniref:ANIS5_cation-bd domain-containing protein n=1 Tax=Haemonchus contortus TaxID=6289 RepID=A0A7I4YJ07_HAECO